MIQKLKVSDLKRNPNNPRIIKDDKFQRLVDSIKAFPEMLEARPIVVNQQLVVLGGNMRLKALQEAGVKEVAVEVVDWTEDQQRQFVIKDNVGFGEWDYDQLANEWDSAALSDWGLDVWNPIEPDIVGQFDDPEDESSEAVAEEDQRAQNSLSAQFIVPPFSVFDTKQGYWQARKTQWKGLGIKSEVGRGGNLLKYSDTILASYNPKQKLAEIVKGISPNANNIESLIPDYYTQKKSGKEDAEIIKEFIEQSALAGTSIFDPVLCEISYKWFCVPEGKVLDPFAGGSVRAVVADKVGLAYTGIELRKEQIEANIEQVLEICGPKHNVNYHHGNSSNLTALVEDEFDMVFTCPPYYDLEQYSDDPEDLSTMNSDEFDESYRDIIQQAVFRLKENSFSVFVVGDVRAKNGLYLDLIGKTVQYHREAGAHLYNHAILLESGASAALRAARIFNGGRKLTKVHQNVLVFYKGDPSAIKDKFSNIISEEEPEAAEATEYGEKISLPVDI